MLLARILWLFEHGTAVATVIADVDDIALIGQKFCQMRVASAIFALPVQELDNRFGLGLGTALVR